MVRTKCYPTAVASEEDRKLVEELTEMNNRLLELRRRQIAVTAENETIKREIDALCDISDGISQQMLKRCIRNEHQTNGMKSTSTQTAVAASNAARQSASKPAPAKASQALAAKPKKKTSNKVTASKSKDVVLKSAMKITPKPANKPPATRMLRNHSVEAFHQETVRSVQVNRTVRFVEQQSSRNGMVHQVSTSSSSHSSRTHSEKRTAYILRKFKMTPCTIPLRDCSPQIKRIKK